MTKARRLRELAVAAYWAARTPTEAKMAMILMLIFAPDVVMLNERANLQDAALTCSRRSAC